MLHCDYPAGYVECTRLKHNFTSYNVSDWFVATRAVEGARHSNVWRSRDSSETNHGGRGIHCLVLGSVSTPCRSWCMNIVDPGLVVSICHIVSAPTTTWISFSFCRCILTCGFVPNVCVSCGVEAFTVAKVVQLVAYWLAASLHSCWHVIFSRLVATSETNMFTSSSIADSHWTVKIKKNYIQVFIEIFTFDR